MPVITALPIFGMGQLTTLNGGFFAPFDWRLIGMNFISNSCMSLSPFADKFTMKQHGTHDT